MEVMERYIRSRGEAFLSRPNINAVGIGYKMVGGKRTDQLAVQFSVDSKVAVPESLDSEPIPETVSFEGVEFPTDVVQRSFKTDYQLVAAPQKDRRKQRLDPIVPGVSIGHRSATAGTLGAIVMDRQSGLPVMLSNWHVLHTPEGEIGDPVVQPGRYDDNRTDENVVGTLVRSHLGLAGDCAIASLDARHFDGTILDLGRAVNRIAKAELDDKVVKSGRTTGVTRGVVTRVSMVTQLNYGDGIVEKIGGFEISLDPNFRPPSDEISKGGDSGSAWMAIGADGKPSDIMIGLHFGGDAEDSDGEYALACQAHSVFEKLEIEPVPANATVQEVRAENVLATGYDPAFLGEELPLPTFTPTARKDLASLDEKAELRYCHFSVWLSRARRLPRMVAWNIDGATIQYLGRKGLDFVKDERGDLEDYQIGDELYAGNPFDRGHVARRADLCWGSDEEAARANRDSFYFTNMTPQHERFNQSKLKGLWGKLENAVFDEAEPDDLKVSLFAGPILASDDPHYTKPDEGLDVQVPTEFWKIVLFVDRGALALRGFILTQRDLVKKVVRAETLELDEFRWFQVPIADIGAKTGIRFPAVWNKLERLPAPQALGAGPAGARLIESDADFFA
ncbi:endonuclease [Rhizorhabdus dicambivorans]|uniref:Endonuclease n=2 Tax=Rhizorhabdus dicambivorans TaxID=1850238 RepID=A0A2A4FTP1_9SPHN|nr:endonuclease [Rhizorhabdus dicambivorans]PCE41100.1 endonuclease [Rhizorhabdus dicambivorans]